MRFIGNVQTYYVQSYTEIIEQSVSLKSKKKEQETKFISANLTQPIHIISVCFLPIFVTLFTS